MTYLDLFKSQRQLIIDTFESKFLDVKEGMTMLVEKNKGSADFFINMCDTEEEAVSELLEIVTSKMTIEQGRKASFRLEETAIESNRKLKMSI